MIASAKRAEAVGKTLCENTANIFDTLLLGTKEGKSWKSLVLSHPPPERDNLLLVLLSRDRKPPSRRKNMREWI